MYRLLSNLIFIEYIFIFNAAKYENCINIGIGNLIDNSYLALALKNLGNKFFTYG
jgi:hypothetical protein